MEKNKEVILTYNNNSNNYWGFINDNNIFIKTSSSLSNSNNDLSNIIRISNLTIDESNESEINKILIENNTVVPTTPNPTTISPTTIHPTTAIPTKIQALENDDQSEKKSIEEKKLKKMMSREKNKASIEMVRNNPL